MQENEDAQRAPARGSSAPPKAVPAACNVNPLASPLAGGSAKPPVSTSKGLHSFSLGRRKQGQLTALDVSELPPKRVCTPTATAGPSGVSPTCGSTRMRPFLSAPCSYSIASL